MNPQTNSHGSVRALPRGADAEETAAHVRIVIFSCWRRNEPAFALVRRCGRAPCPPTNVLRVPRCNGRIVGNGERGGGRNRPQRLQIKSASRQLEFDDDAMRWPRRLGAEETQLVVRRRVALEQAHGVVIRVGIHTWRSTRLDVSTAATHGIAQMIAATHGSPDPLKSPQRMGLAQPLGSPQPMGSAQPLGPLPPPPVESSQPAGTTQTVVAAHGFAGIVAAHGISAQPMGSLPSMDSPPPTGSYGIAAPHIAGAAALHAVDATHGAVRAETKHVVRTSAMDDSIGDLYEATVFGLQ